MNTSQTLFSADWQSLSKGRAQAHLAAQIVTRAARANLAPVEDDSHSSLAWLQKNRTLNSQNLSGASGQVVLGLRIEDLTLVLRNVTGEDEISLSGKSMEEATIELDALLERDGLSKTAGIDLPYELPPEVAAITRFDADGLKDELGSLASWYGFAARLLEDLAQANANLKPGPSPVRCWPHHFDIATYVSLEPGDAENAKGIGVGLSPGDETYAQPYFYVNPWPHLDAADLPKAPSPGHWHTDGFVGLIATADEIKDANDFAPSTHQFLHDAFSVGLKRLAGRVFT